MALTEIKVDVGTCKWDTNPIKTKSKRSRRQYTVLNDRQELHWLSVYTIC